MAAESTPIVPLSFDADWDKLIELARLVQRDAATGDLVIRNGLSTIRLAEDGTIRLHGTRIIQVADENISLDAAFIDLN